MKRKSLEDLDPALIKAHVNDPEHSPLTKQQAELYSRLVSAAKVRDRYPNLKNAVAIHRVKYPQIGRSQAYADFTQAARLFPSVHTFDYDFWNAWLINDIHENIAALEKMKTASSRSLIAREHASLITLLGTGPKKAPDPKRSEKHEYYIICQAPGMKETPDLDQLAAMPVATKEEVIKFVKEMKKGR